MTGSGYDWGEHPSPYRLPRVIIWPRHAPLALAGFAFSLIGVAGVIASNAAMAAMRSQSLHPAGVPWPGACMFSGITLLVAVGGCALGFVTGILGLFQQGRHVYGIAAVIISVAAVFVEIVVLVLTGCS